MHAIGNELAQQQVPARMNPGWFQPGDPRINRRGRPQGSKAGAEEKCVASRPDRVRVLVLRESDLRHRLTNGRSAWVKNWPMDGEIVECRVDGGEVYFFIRSKTFAWIAKGTPVPPFLPDLDGGKWRRFAKPGQVGSAQPLYYH